MDNIQGFFAVVLVALFVVYSFLVVTELSYISDQKKNRFDLFCFFFVFSIGAAGCSAYYLW